MEDYAISLSLLGGVVFYAYAAWIARDRDDPTNAKKVFRNSVGLLALALVLALLLVLPWSIAEGWSFVQVATADLPQRKMRSTIYVIYASVVAGGLGILHAAIARFLFRAPRAGGG